jgi:hypothetical protein
MSFMQNILGNLIDKFGTMSVDETFFFMTKVSNVVEPLIPKIKSLPIEKQVIIIDYIEKILTEVKNGIV